MKKILVLEDDQERIRQFKERFSERNCEAVFVETADDCIEQLSTVEYDIVFLDHDLGGEQWVDIAHTNTGSEVARFWHQKENMNKEAIVVIHSYNNYGAEYMQKTIQGSFYLPSIWIKEKFDRNIIIS